MDVNSKRSPVLAVMATLASLHVLVGGAALGDVVGAKVAGLLGLMVAAAEVGAAIYVRGLVTPWDAVVAKVNDAGTIVAGPAAQTTTGAPVEEPVPLDVPPVPGP